MLQPLGYTCGQLVNWTDEVDVARFRYRQYKMLYMIKEAIGIEVWRYPLTKLRAPHMMTLRGDPFERAYTEGPGFDSWTFTHMFLMVLGMALVQKYLQTFLDFSPRQSPGTVDVEAIMKSLTDVEKRMTV